MKAFIAGILVLAPFMVQAQTCHPTDVAYLRKYITNDMRKNGDIVLSLLDQAATGTTNCTFDETVLPSPEVSLATCGYPDGGSLVKLTIAQGQQNYVLTILKQKFECGGAGVFLTDIQTAHGSVLNTIAAEDQVMAQIRSCGGEVADDYQAITFASEQETGTLTRIVNTNSLKACSQPTLKSAVLSFSLGTLGIGAAEVATLKKGFQP